MHVSGLDGARISGPNVFGAPLAMLHGSRALVASHMPRVSMSGVSSVVDWSQAWKIQSWSETEAFLQMFGSGKTKNKEQVQTILQAHVYVPSNIAVD